MYAIGIDIGTTSICAAALECGAARIVDTAAAPNNSYISAGRFESVQDPRVILNAVVSVLEKLCRDYNPVKVIGISCQMHGIVYVDAHGNAVSPLYTWQDGRGDLMAPDGGTYADELGKLTGYAGLATGFGTVTHYYNVKNRIVPPSAAWFCTIGDYIAMKLTGDAARKTHASSAASFALYNMADNCFDVGAITKAGMDPALFPAAEAGCGLFGVTRGAIYDDEGAMLTDGVDAGTAVSFCIGDNQAGFLGAVAQPESSVLLNVGTGGQISVSGAGLKNGPGLEVRPLFGDRFLQVGATLCAGRAYAELERFFSSVLRMAGAETRGHDALYEAMGRMLENNGLDDPLAVSVKFSGTRDEPNLRGSITNIGLDNFTPAHLASGFLNGIANEFYELYKHMDGAGKRSLLIGSGNGIRKNAYLRKTLAERFKMPILIPKHIEEAAYGCALFALTACGYYKDLAEAQAGIVYMNG
jgi:sedoheptulokinase